MVQVQRSTTKPKEYIPLTAIHSVDSSVFHPYVALGSSDPVMALSREDRETYVRIDGDKEGLGVVTTSLEGRIGGFDELLRMHKLQVGDALAGGMSELTVGYGTQTVPVGRVVYNMITWVEGSASTAKSISSDVFAFRFYERSVLEQHGFSTDDSSGRRLIITPEVKDVFDEDLN